jgi:hypothetical protein
MQNAAGSPGSAQSADRNDRYRAVVCELRSLLERVQVGMDLVEAAIAAESSLSNQEFAANVVVLDDVTPRYLRTNAALDTCNAGLRMALHVLQDARTAQREADEPAEPVRLPARSILRA